MIDGQTTFKGAPLQMPPIPALSEKDPPPPPEPTVSVPEVDVEDETVPVNDTPRPDRRTRYEYIHPACQAVAFTLDALPPLGVSLVPVKDLPVTCEHCGAKLPHLHRRHLRETT